MTDEQEQGPKLTHRYLQAANGLPLELLRMTDETCPACGKGPKPNKLAVFQESPGQETVHCIACDFHQVRKPKPSPKTFRPMNSGQR